MLYLISGKIKTGKDTCGKFIIKEYEKLNKRACIIPISYSLRNYAKDYFGWDGKEETKPRTLLQQLGTEVIREHLKKDRFLIDRIIDDIEILSLYYDVVIITGIRRKEEIFALKEKFKDAINIHLIRNIDYSNLSEEQKNHYTERDLDDFKDYDYLIENESLETLEEKIKEIVREEVVKDEKND